MVPMPMAPYNSIDQRIIDAALFQDLIDVLGDVEAGNAVLD